MRKGIIFGALFAITIALCLRAATTTNGRIVPQAVDFSEKAGGNAWQYKQYDSLLTEAATILPSTGTRPVDAIDVDSVRTTYIKGNPTADSLTIAGPLAANGISTINMKYDSIVINTSGADTLAATESGGLFVATKSDGATTFTLPDASAATNGCVWTFFQQADQNLVVTATTADNNDFVADAVATSDQVSCATASHKIGSGIVVYGANSKYFAFELNAECPLTVEAAD